MSDEEAADIGLITAVGIDTVKDGQVGIVNSGFRLPDSAAATQVSVQMRLILVRPLTIGTRETLTGHFFTWNRRQPREKYKQQVRREPISKEKKIHSFQQIP